MSEHETLELELRSMRPRAASAELRRRVINQLETSAPLQSQRSWSVALAGALAAACLAAVALWRTGDPHAQSNQNGSTSNVASAADIADLSPTVLAYRHALVRSPAHFSALLDKHSLVTLPHNPARNGIRAFVRPDNQQPSWTGEL
ncbi:MAG TPA: hypothetical protein VJ809_01185 [Pirellulales bacterium]|nr:hypothetical protein [Pirellulales bacterium]